MQPAIAIPLVRVVELEFAVFGRGREHQGHDVSRLRVQRRIQFEHLEYVRIRFQSEHGAVHAHGEGHRERRIASMRAHVNRDVSGSQEGRERIDTLLGDCLLTFGRMKPARKSNGATCKCNLCDLGRILARPPSQPEGPRQIFQLHRTYRTGLGLEYGAV